MSQNTTLTPELQEQWNTLQDAIKNAKQASNGGDASAVKEAQQNMHDFMNSHPGLKDQIRKVRKEKYRAERKARMNSPEAKARREKSKAAMANLRKMNEAYFANQKKKKEEKKKKGGWFGSSVLGSLGYFARKVKSMKKQMAQKMLSRANKKAAAAKSTKAGQSVPPTELSNDTVLEILYLMVSTPEELEDDKDEEHLLELECHFVENGGDLQDLMFYN